jgi:hypothetical protein
MVNSQFNVLTQSVFNKVRQAVMAPETPWYSVSTDYYNAQTPDHYSHSWAHLAFSDGVANSPLGELLHMAALSALDNTGQEVGEIVRIRLGLHTISPQTRYGGAHVDYNLPHRVALLYLNDSDGDTLVFNEKYDPNSNADTYHYFQDQYQGKASVIHRSTPAANKMIWFDGMHYHSSSSPTTVAKRITININYLLK